MMSAISWDEIIIVIFFVYGLAFYSLGLALLVESGRASQLGFARSMRLLAGFGLLHGVHEWIDMLERVLILYHQTALPVWAQWVRLAILTTSFLALLAFGEHLLMRERNPSAPLWRLTMVVFIWYAVSTIFVQLAYSLNESDWLAGADVLARYVLGVPSGVMACWALWQQRRIFRERGMGLFVRELTLAAVAIGVYGVIGQFFTRESAIYPSMIINDDLFLQIAGFPIQLFRAALAIIVAAALIRVVRALEVEYQQRLQTVEQEKLETEQLSREALTRLNAELQAANEETVRLLAEVRRRDTLRGELLQRITGAQESERQRIARELHDGTGQALTGLALGLRGLAVQVHQNPELTGKRLPVLETMATSALGELRHLINDLRPPQLDDMGLVAALRWMVARFADEKPAVSLEIQGEPRALPAEIETTLFRIAQEGLTNAAKHADADHIAVCLDFNNGFSLTVKDDGVGFVPEEVLQPDSLRTAWGLLGIQERVNLIDATLILESAPGCGTTFTARICENRNGR